MVDLFPTQIRYSGVATCFTCGALLGGGLTPLWTSTILNYLHDYRYIIIVCIIISVLCLAAGVLLNKFLNQKNLSNAVPS
jgi:MFS family permease